MAADHSAFPLTVLSLSAQPTVFMSRFGATEPILHKLGHSARPEVCCVNPFLMQLYEACLCRSWRRRRRAESWEKCKLQGQIQQTSKKLQKQRAAVSGLLQISPKTTHTKLNAFKRELKEAGCCCVLGGFKAFAKHARALRRAQCSKKAWKVGKPFLIL